MELKPNAPLKVIRDGAIKATIGRNEGEHGAYLTVTFARTFTKDDQAEDSNSFKGRDMLVLAEIARQAYCWTGNHRSRTDNSETEPK